MSLTGEVDNTLNVARIENKSLKFSIESILNEVTSIVVQDTKDQIDNIEGLQYQNTGNYFRGRREQGKIAQVMSNLLSNSIKFTKEGVISVNMGKKEVVTVIYTGQEIDDEILPKLFSRSATKSELGVGLELFVCNTIVKAHGGMIWAENNPDGKGAMFRFSLPSVSRTDSSSCVSLC